MSEENKNLEAQKKTGKSWRFRIGIGLISLAIVLIWWIFQQPQAEGIPVLPGLFMFFPLSLLAIGIFFILVHYFLKHRKKERFSVLDWIIFICVILFIIVVLIGPIESLLIRFLIRTIL